MAAQSPRRAPTPPPCSLPWGLQHGPAVLDTLAAGAHWDMAELLVAGLRLQGRARPPERRHRPAAEPHRPVARGHLFFFFLGTGRSWVTPPPSVKYTQFRVPTSHLPQTWLTVDKNANNVKQIEWKNIKCTKKGCVLYEQSWTASAPVCTSGRGVLNLGGGRVLFGHFELNLSFLASHVDSWFRTREFFKLDGTPPSWGPASMFPPPPSQQLPAGLNPHPELGSKFGQFGWKFVHNFHVSCGCSQLHFPLFLFCSKRYFYVWLFLCLF